MRRVASFTRSDHASGLDRRPSISSDRDWRVCIDACILFFMGCLLGWMPALTGTVLWFLCRGCTPQIFPASLGLNQVPKVGFPSGVYLQHVPTPEPACPRLHRVIGAPPDKVHRRRLRGEAGAQAHVRRHAPGRRAMAAVQDHRLRAPPDERPQTGTGSELRGGKRHQEALGRCAPEKIIQHLQDLTVMMLDSAFKTIQLFIKLLF